MRAISLDDSIDGPQYSIELSTGQFVVCHEGATQHRVLIVDNEGHIIESYGGPDGSSTGQLDGPRCLTVDRYDNVYVADWNNDKVQLLSPTMTHLCDVTLSKHQLSEPCRIHLDEMNGLMYIGEGSGRLLVVSVKQTLCALCRCAVKHEQQTINEIIISDTVKVMLNIYVKCYVKFYV